MANSSKEENPLANIIINVLIPVLVLSYMSKDPGLVDDPKPWYIGPYKSLFVALIIPIGYGIYHFIKAKSLNLFSGVGILSVLLTGGVTLYLWNKDGTVKPDAALWFGIKEAIQPLILGGVVLASHWTKSPLFKEFIYNEGIFDISRVEKSVEEKGVQQEYKKLLLTNTLIFCASFILSAILNVLVAQHFLGGLDHTAANAQEMYNQSVAKINGWGYLLIGVPILVIAIVIIAKHTKDLKNLTGLMKEEVLLLGS